MEKPKLKNGETAAPTPDVACQVGAAETQRSLDDVHATVPVLYPGFWRRLFAFAGPAYLVSVGYMDPGNWATDIEGGSKFNYELIWVLVMSNGMALLLQTLSARLGIVSGRDLAQACRESYPRTLNLALWVLCEIAIAACDLAEVIGTIIGLKLLFGLAPLYGLILTGFDTFLFLAIQRFGIRKMEAFILVLVSTIGLCFLIEIVLAQPAWGAVAQGLLPRFRDSAPYLFSSDEALYVAISILGATVMPHNLYLHSALVQTRQISATRAGLRQACWYNFLDSAVALNAAFFINAAILVLAAATFYQHPELWGNLKQIELEDAHGLLHRVLGSHVAPMAFAIALLCSGQSSTLTGTLAGQVVMEGFLRFRLQPWVRRLFTRLLAIVPALLTILLAGEGSMMKLLVLSQVVLSLQLPFAVASLLQFTSDRKRMGEFASPLWARALGWLVFTIIVVLNARVVAVQIAEWIADAGDQALWVEITVVPIAIGCGLLLAWLIAAPWFTRPRHPTAVGPAAQAAALEVAAGLTTPVYSRIGVALENGPRDVVTLRHAAALAQQHGAELLLLHVVEGVGGQVHGERAADLERRGDQVYLEQLAKALQQRGVTARAVLRFGDPAQELSRAVAEEHLDLLVFGSHGHGFLADWLFGETTGQVRHIVRIPVMVVRERD